MLSFNRKVKDDVFLLFDAALTSELLLLRADDGVEVPVGASGERHIKAGDAYTVGLRIRDPVSGELIAFSDLPEDTLFTNQVSGPSTSWNERMQRNDSKNRAESILSTEDIGKLKISAAVSIPRICNA